ncbi:hypothetical protein CB1_000995027 [Camelus ferus]|nr:hypothetical protein CB1_000995027 [Camelus ferus]
MGVETLASDCPLCLTAPDVVFDREEVLKLQAELTVRDESPGTRKDTAQWLFLSESEERSNGTHEPISSTASRGSSSLPPAVSQPRMGLDLRKCPITPADLARREVRAANDHSFLFGGRVCAEDEMGAGEGTEGPEEPKGRSRHCGQRAGSSLERITSPAEIPELNLTSKDP